MKKDVICLKFPLKGKYVVMLAPSFVVDFDYPSIIWQFKKLGFDKVVEVTFGAKMINRDYQKILKNSKKLWIATVCPGITETIKQKFPKYVKNLIPVDSPMIAMGKICRKTFPKHKIVFISPCYFKKIEAVNSKYVDYVIDYKELKELFLKYKIKKNNKKIYFDKFYNDYTKIYPTSGGLTRTAHFEGIIKPEEVLIADGIKKVIKFLKKPNKKIRFLDTTFCIGSCIGGPCVSSNLTIDQRKKKVIKYLEKSKQEDIPEPRKGLIKKAKGIKFSN
ncbi:MAG: [Fe-Fe] hydrogenase large subunit C-terminal domain-containing protein [bacterium]